MDTHSILKHLVVVILGVALALLAVVWTDAVAPGLDVTTQVESESDAPPPSDDSPGSPPSHAL